MSAAPANRLAREKSPYLLQHAHNPVDWFPWGTEALERAKREDKPIFLSVGYSACHWCHVMERESFEDDAAAALLNAHFVCIKVDREERPDVDEIYMTAVQMMTGSGGWPMSVFLTPDGRPFYGGTYFPPDSRFGRPGFKSLVTQLAEAFQTRRGEVEQVADSIASDLRKATRQRPLLATPETALDPNALLAGAVADCVARFDAENGGFGGAPKFPPHHALRLLCKAVRRGDTPETTHLLFTTLDKMAMGGIYDHIGGGFHRYATDALWLLPHFEKMLYDNALLARVYAEAYAITGREAYARIARETCDWVLREMTDAAGGFHAALDADSEGEEGKYYVWTRAEIESLLGPEAGSAFCDRYQIRAGGNYRDEASGHTTDANIPHLAVGASPVALPDTLEPAFAHSRARLLEQRLQRVPPGKDDKVIAGWNGLMIGALAFVGKTLGAERYTEAARRAADFCLTTLRPQSTLLRRYAGGEAGLTAFLDDHAYLADGLLDLYDATGEPRWADAARSLADTLLADFWDAEDSGFFFSGAGHEALIAQSKDLFDGATPSANGVAARALVRLSHISESGYGKKAHEMLVAFRGVMARAPQGTQTLLLAALDDAMDENPAVLRADNPIPGLIAHCNATLAFTLLLSPDFHINANQPGLDYLIPTVATAESDLPAVVGPVIYPTPVIWRAGGDAISTYQGGAKFRVPIVFHDDAEPGWYMLTLTIRFQLCSEAECLLPDERTVTIPVKVSSRGRHTLRGDIVPRTSS